MTDLTPDVLEMMLERAAKRGAKLALEDVGLHDEDAGSDIRDLRGLLGAYNTAKKSATKAFWHWATVVLLSIAAGWFFTKTGIKIPTD